MQMSSAEMQPQGIRPQTSLMSQLQTLNHKAGQRETGGSHYLPLLDLRGSQHSHSEAQDPN